MIDSKSISGQEEDRIIYIKIQTLDKQVYKENLSIKKKDIS